MYISNLARDYPAVLWEVATHGTEVAPRGDVTREILNFNLTVESGHAVLPVKAGRGVKPSLADEQALQLIAGVYVPERLAFGNPNFVDDDQLENYGPLLAPGIARSVEYLQADRHTRRAAANLGHTGGDSGYPCTLGLGWLIRDDKLIAFSEMRSQDAWLGLPYDLYMFAALQRSMAYVLDVEPGPLHHRVRSFHIYERDLEKVPNVRPAQPPYYPTLAVYGDNWDHTVELAGYILDTDGHLHR